MFDRPAAEIIGVPEKPHNYPANKNSLDLKNIPRHSILCTCCCQYLVNVTFVYFNSKIWVGRDSLFKEIKLSICAAVALSGKSVSMDLAG